MKTESLSSPSSRSPSTSIEFNTSGYRFATGKEPRGGGSWGFSAKRNYDSTTDVFWANGTYGEAKKAARAHFSALGVSYVYVCS
jgi:hypothetical protein